MIGLFLIWLLFGICAAIVASQRGSNGCLWMLIGLVLGPIGFALAFTEGATCDRCGKRVSTKASVCPYCQTVFATEGTPALPTQTPKNELGGIVLREDFGKTKQCPFCAEQIKEEAIKCKHCGSMLT